MISNRWLLILLTFHGLAQAQIDLTKAKPLKVAYEKEGIVFLEPPKVRTPLSPFVVFVRPAGGDFEIIARGKVETVQDGKVLISLDRESILKFPLPGDLAVPMGSPQDWPPDYDPKIAEPSLQAQEVNSIPEPGYIEFAYGATKGSLTTDSSDGRTNQFKSIPKYQPTYFHFAWYFDFLWRFGIELENFSGTFPTSTYYRNTGDSTEKISALSLNYRFRPQWFDHRLRPMVRVLSFSEQFTTLNPDEALISSSVSAKGLGLRLSFERDSMVWKPANGSGFKFLQAYLDLNYYPLVTISDAANIQRGSSSAGSTMTEIKVAMSSLLYVRWMPLFKRYNFEIGYGQRMSKYAFQGPTQSEVGGFYTVPQNTSSSEKTSYFYLSLGLRFEDLIGRLLKPR